jgi:glycosyltransferase involved in cell wall biosynthesis
MRKIRVLWLIDELALTGGAELFALGLATHLPGDRFDRWFCSTRLADPGMEQVLADAGVEHVHLDRRTKWDFHRFGPLPRVLRRERIDILHAHKFGSNVWGTMIGRAARVPIVLAHEQTWSYEGEPLRRLLDGQLVGRLATRFIAVSSRDAERMSSVEGVPREKIVMIPNAYVPRPPTPDADLRAELGIAPSTPLIGVVAILRPQKALSVLLEAHARLLESVPDAHVVIAGDGESRPELEGLSRQLGTAERVHFLGLRHDIDAILRSIDVAAISSDYEGTPLVAFECMANRTPLVATAVGGLPDIIRDGETGILIPPRDPEALAHALSALLGDPDRRRQMGEASAGQLHEFTIDSIANRFADLYESLFENIKDRSGRWAT